MKLNYKITEADYVHAVWLNMRPRKGFRIVGIILLILFLVYGICLISQLIKTGQWKFPLTMFFLAVAYLGLIAWLLFYRRPKRIYRQTKILQDSVLVEITETHLKSKNTHAESALPWDMFHKWKAGKSMVLIYQSDAMMHVFPRHGFASDGDFKSFQEFLTKKIGSAK